MTQALTNHDPRIKELVKEVGTLQRALFVWHYVECWNAKKAAEAAGLMGAVTAYVLLDEPRVCAAIARRVRRIDKTTLMSAEDLLQRDSELASIDPFGIFIESDEDDDSEPRLELRDPRDIPLEVRRCVAKIIRNADGRFYVAFHSPHPALARLHKYWATQREARPRGTGTGSNPDEGIEDDEVKARLAADWLERLCQRLGTNDATKIIEALRAPKVVQGRARKKAAEAEAEIEDAEEQHPPLSNR